jgi:hypothetical protein
VGSCRASKNKLTSLPIESDNGPIDALGNRNITLTVHRLGIGAVLRRKLATTNPIESCLSTVQRVARNVKRWREGDQPLRWTATGLLEAEKKIRRIKGLQEILLLKERLNPSRLPQKEVRIVEVA